MRTSPLIITMLLLIVSRVVAQEASPNATALEIIRDMNDLFKKVQDKSSAEEHLPKLKALDSRLPEVAKVRPQLTPAEEEKLSDLIAVGDNEMLRLEVIPEVRGLFFKELALFRASVRSNWIAAETQIKTISLTLKLYHLHHKKYPENLKVLTEGKDPYIKPRSDSLIDPWNKPFQYDPKGPKNNGDAPDVWTVSPDGEVIGNWVKTK